MVSLSYQIAQGLQSGFLNRQCKQLRYSQGLFHKKQRFIGALGQSYLSFATFKPIVQHRLSKKHHYCIAASAVICTGVSAYLQLQAEKSGKNQRRSDQLNCVLDQMNQAIILTSALYYLYIGASGYGLSLIGVLAATELEQQKYTPSFISESLHLSSGLNSLYSLLYFPKVIKFPIATLLSGAQIGNSYAKRKKWARSLDTIQTAIFEKIRQAQADPETVKTLFALKNAVDSYALSSCISKQRGNLEERWQRPSICQAVALICWENSTPRWQLITAFVEIGLQEITKSAFEQAIHPQTRSLSYDRSDIQKIINHKGPALKINPAAMVKSTLPYNQDEQVDLRDLITIWNAIDWDKNMAVVLPTMFTAMVPRLGTQKTGPLNEQLVQSYLSLHTVFQQYATDNERSNLSKQIKDEGGGFRIRTLPESWIIVKNWFDAKQHSLDLTAHHSSAATAITKLYTELRTCLKTNGLERIIDIIANQQTHIVRVDTEELLELAQQYTQHVNKEWKKIQSLKEEEEKDQQLTSVIQLLIEFGQAGFVCSQGHAGEIMENLSLALPEAGVRNIETRLNNKLANHRTTLLFPKVANEFIQGLPAIIQDIFNPQNQHGHARLAYIAGNQLGLNINSSLTEDPTITANIDIQAERTRFCQIFHRQYQEEIVETVKQIIDSTTNSDSPLFLQEVVDWVTKHHSLYQASATLLQNAQGKSEGIDHTLCEALDAEFTSSEKIPSEIGLFNEFLQVVKQLIRAQIFFSDQAGMEQINQVLAYLDNDEHLLVIWFFMFATNELKKQKDNTESTTLKINYQTELTKYQSRRNTIATIKKLLTLKLAIEAPNTDENIAELIVDINEDLSFPLTCDNGDQELLQQITTQKQAIIEKFSSESLPQWLRLDLQNGDDDATLTAAYERMELGRLVALNELFPNSSYQTPLNEQLTKCNLPSLGSLQTDSHMNKRQADLDRIEQKMQALQKWFDKKIQSCETITQWINNQLFHHIAPQFTEIASILDELENQQQKE